MSQISEEIESRKALLAAEADARTAKLKLHKTMLKGATDPFLSIIQDLEKDGWYAEDSLQTVLMSPPSEHMLETWQSINSGDRKTFYGYFKVTEDSSLTVKFDGKPITTGELREKLLDHVAQYYVKKERARR